MCISTIHSIFLPLTAGPFTVNGSTTVELVVHTVTLTVVEVVFIIVGFTVVLLINEVFTTGALNNVPFADRAPFRTVPLAIAPLNVSPPAVVLFNNVPLASIVPFSNVPFADIVPSNIVPFGAIVGFNKVPFGAIDLTTSDVLFTTAVFCTVVVLTVHTVVLI